MLQNRAYLLAKNGTDTAENEQLFADILPIGRRVADRRRREALRPLGGARGASSSAPVRATALAPPWAYKYQKTDWHLYAHKI